MYSYTTAGTIKAHAARGARDHPDPYTVPGALCGHQQFTHLLRVAVAERRRDGGDRRDLPEDPGAGGEPESRGAQRPEPIEDAAGAKLLELVELDLKPDFEPRPERIELGDQPGNVGGDAL